MSGVCGAKPIPSFLPTIYLGLLPWHKLLFRVGFVQCKAYPILCNQMLSSSNNYFFHSLYKQGPVHGYGKPGHGRTNFRHQAKALLLKGPAFWAGRPTDHPKEAG